MSTNSAIHVPLSAGARRFKACVVLGIDVRTLQRWQKALKERDELADRRKAAVAERTPANKLSAAEREAILAICNQPNYQSLLPSQMVPRLADEATTLSARQALRISTPAPVRYG